MSDVPNQSGDQTTPNTGGQNSGVGTQTQGTQTQGTQNAGSEPPKVDTTGAQSGNTNTPAPEPIDINLPQGVTADPELLEAVKASAKDKAAAQKLVDTYLAAQQKAQEKSKAEWETKVQGWAKEIREHKEFGGPKYEESQALVKKVMTRYGNEELKQFLDETGLGNHPKLAEFIIRVGRDMSEGTVRTGAVNTGTSEDDILRTRYPSMY